MTFDDDMVTINFTNGPVRQTCIALGLEWPPPEFIIIFGFTFKRLRLSSISDEQRASMTNVCRGAEYGPDEESK